MAKYVNIHTHNPSKDEIELINAPTKGNWPGGELFSFGLHPWDINGVDEKIVLEDLEQYCKQKKIAAIGETGLDRAINIPIKKQLDCFVKQLDIAEKYDLPVIIHNVRATSDLLQLKKTRANATPWIFHGFRGNEQEAVQLIDKQCLLSFGKAVLNQTKTQKVLKRIPLKYVFFETDDSDEKISTIYEKAAEILDICTAELKDKIYSNFVNVFGEKCRKIG